MSQTPCDSGSSPVRIEAREGWQTRFGVMQAEKRVPAAAKLHTARSRNDQVATAFRLWCRAHAHALAREHIDHQGESRRSEGRLADADAHA